MVTGFGNRVTKISGFESDSMTVLLRRIREAKTGPTKIDGNSRHLSSCRPNGSATNQHSKKLIELNRGPEIQPDHLAGLSTNGGVTNSASGSCSGSAFESAKE